MDLIGGSLNHLRRKMVGVSRNKEFINALTIHVHDFKTKSILLKFSAFLRDMTEMMQYITTDGLVTVGFHLPGRKC